ncbi:MAG: flagellar basal body L-ring protein FlgH [Nautilia sp.]|nr:MAG: flagellar basal body L-ring protein FlgH [Nautilia sp.]
MIIYLYFLIPLFFIGCSHHPMDPDIDIKPPKYVEQMPSKDVEVSHNVGSLFNNGDNLFSDKKAMKVNDIVTVLINFKVKASSSGKRQTSEATTTPMGGVNMLVNGINHISNVTGLPNLGLNTLTDNTTTRNFQGQGSNTRDDSFSATVTARIIKVLKNGNYFIAGSREVLIDGEKNIIRVCGVIRASDIDSTNTIDSKYIADAKIEYKTEGEIERATNKNWFAKFLDAVSPF